MPDTATRALQIEIKKSDLLRNFPKAVGRFFAPNELIFSEKESAHSCFFIHQGSIAIHKKGGDGQNFNLAKIEVGQFLGEMAMLSGQKRGATAVALTRVEALEITSSEFRALAGSGNPLAGRLALYFAIELAERSSQLLDLLGKQATPNGNGSEPKKAKPSKVSKPRATGAKKAPTVDARQVLHKVYSSWAV